MKVYYDLNYFSKEQFGGISRVWMEYFRQLPKSPIEPIFFSVQSRNFTHDFLEKKNYYNAIVYKERNFRKIHRIKRWAFYRNWKYTFSNQLKDGIFHSTDYICPMIKQKKLKVVSTIHDMVFFDEKLLFKKTIDYYDKVWSIRHAINISDRVIVPSESTKKSILNYFPKSESKIRVNYWGIHASISNKLITKEKEHYFLFIGARNCYKNYRLLLKSFALFLKDNPHWKLYVVGENDGTKDGERALYHALGIADNIVDFGYVNQDILTNLIMRTSGVVIPSFCEGFNFPLLEAMALGAPVFSSDIPVSRELGKHYVQYFSPHSVSSLLILMIAAVKEPVNHRLLLDAQRYAHTFTWNKSFSNLVNIYDECLTI